MNIRDEEQLQQYFERAMTSGEEQNFLINVAARDDMRLAFRSQLELLKAVREDKDASGSPTFVRSKTLAALGLGGALLPSSLKEQSVAAEQAAALSPTILQKIGIAFKRPVVSIATGLLAGVLGTSFFIQPSANQPPPPSVSPMIIHEPAVQAAPQIASPAAQEENRSYKSHRTYTTKPNNAGTAVKNSESPVINKANPLQIENKRNMHKPEDSGK